MDKNKIEKIGQTIIDVGKRLYQKGMVAAHDGNISARLNETDILITPSGRCKGFLQLNDLIQVHCEGKIVRGNLKPSSEMAMHLTIYKERKDVFSICHAHPVYATAFSVAGLALDKPILPEVIIPLGPIPLVPYSEPGTEAVSKNILPFLENHDAFLLANHGAVTVGQDVLHAYYKMETLEHFAKILYRAGMLGAVNTLTENEIKALIQQREKWGVRDSLGSNFSRD